MEKFNVEAFGEDAYKPEIQDRCTGCPRLEALRDELTGLHTLRVGLGLVGTDVDALREMCFENSLENDDLEAIEFYSSSESNQAIVMSLATEIEKIDRQRETMAHAANRLQETCPGSTFLADASRLIGKDFYECNSLADPARVAKQ